MKDIKEKKEYKKLVCPIEVEWKRVSGWIFYPDEQFNNQNIVEERYKKVNK